MARFDHVRIQCSLGEEINPPQFACFCFEDVYEGVPDESSLLLRISNTSQSIKEILTSIYVNCLKAQVSPEELDVALDLPQAKETSIDEDGRQTVSNGPLHQRGCYRGIHPARDGTDDSPVAHLITDRRHSLLHERPRRPIPFAAAHIEEIIPDDISPVGV